MTNIRRLVMSTLLTFSGALLTLPSVAQDDGDADAAEKSSARIPVFAGWTGAATLGASTSTGSAETSNVNGSVRVGKRVGAWENWFSASAFKGQSALVVERRGADGMVIVDDNGDPITDIVRGDTSDRLAAAWQPRYFFSGGTYGFLTFDWEQDKPAGVQVATRQLVGVGHTFYRDDTGFLSVEVGAGNKNLENTAGEEINGAIGFAAVNYLYRVNPNVTFTTNVSGDFSSDNTALDVAVGIAFKLTETLAFGISHFVRSNSDVSNPDNLLSGRRDSVTTMNLVIDI